MQIRFSMVAAAVFVTAAALAIPTIASAHDSPTNDRPTVATREL